VTGLEYYLASTSEDGVYSFDLYLNGPGKRVHCHGKLFHNKRPAPVQDMTPLHESPPQVSKYRRKGAFVEEPAGTSVVHVPGPAAGLTGPDPNVTTHPDVADTIPDTQPTFEETFVYGNDDWTIVD